MRVITAMVVAFGCTVAALGQTGAAPAPTVDQLVAKYVDARGGLDKLHAINSLRLTRKVTFKSADPTALDQSYTAVTEWKRPGMLRTEVRTAQGVAQVETWNGSEGWMESAQEPTPKPLTAEAAAKVPSFSDAVEGEIVDYQRKGYTVALRGMAQAQGRDCYGLITTRPNGSAEYRCLDSHTFLDIERRDATSTSEISDFRPVGGVMFAYKMEIMSKKGTWTYDTENIEVNIPLEEARFQKPAALAPVEAAAQGESFARVQWARDTVTNVLQHVRTCDPQPFRPPCTFSAVPEKITFTKDRIEFWAPLNKMYGGPRNAYIDLAKLPKVLYKQRETWRILDPTWFYYSFEPAEKHFAADSSNILWGKEKLEWTAVDDPKRFLEALEILETNARSSVDAEQRELQDFSARAQKWRALAVKPPLPEAAHEEKVLAEYAIQQGQYEQALQHYEKGLRAYPLWPEGQHNAAAIAAQIGQYAAAIQHARYFLELSGDAPDAENLRDSIIVWKSKLGAN